MCTLVLHFIFEIWTLYSKQYKFISILVTKNFSFLKFLFFHCFWYDIGLWTASKKSPKPWKSRKTSKIVLIGYSKLDQKLMKNENFQKTKIRAIGIDINLYCSENKVHTSKIKYRKAVHTFLTLQNSGRTVLAMISFDNK